MVRAVILIKSPGVFVASEVKNIAGVQDAFDVNGRFDAVALVEAPELAELKRVSLKIREIRGVRKTETMVEI